jgi:Lon protease-like protein
LIRPEIPLFPLNTVLFPGGHLPLRIFEQRYIDMVRDCSRNNSCFGVCLTVISPDAAQTPSLSQVGTTAKISDWSTLPDGLLGIVACGQQEFSILDTRTLDNGLVIANVELFDQPVSVPMPPQFSLLSVIAGRFMDKVEKNYPDFEPTKLQDAVWVGCRLAELLPFGNSKKQRLLELTDPLDRLQLLVEELPQFQHSP